MLEYKTLLRQLCGIMSVSGCERRALGELQALVGDRFDDIRCDPARNIVLLKKSARPNAPRVMLDAHFDEVGMLVTGITDEGFLRVAPVGGIDRQLLPASEVWVYPNPDTDTGNGSRLYGVFAATPPHLVKPGEENKTPDWNDLLIDIGCRTRAEAEALVGIGAPVGYYYDGDELLNRRITGRGLDDKACAAGLLCAVDRVPAEELAYDVYITLSSGEEVMGGGAGRAAYTIQPDFAIITDVNFAQTPGVPEEASGKLGGGPMISLSAVTDRRLTSSLLTLADRAEIGYKKVVEATSTGTNASCICCVNEGIPVAVVSLPLAGMHSYNESLSLDDAEAFLRLISEIVKNPEIGGIN
ncbi:MAG: M42 family metallopeptidase [Eubacteriales bacterium]